MTPYLPVRDQAVVDGDPVVPSTGAGTIAATRPGEAHVSIGADRPSSIVAPESANNKLR